MISTTSRPNPIEAGLNRLMGEVLKRTNGGSRDLPVSDEAGASLPGILMGRT